MTAYFQRSETVRDFNGVVVSKATIKVVTGLTYSDTAPLATLYADAAGLVPLANPFQADAAGQYLYWAELGYYSEQVSRPGYYSETNEGFFLGGLAGPAGPQGLQGLPGVQGAKGDPGEVAYATLADTIDPLKGSGLIGFNSALSYALGTMGYFLKDLSASFYAFIAHLADTVNASYGDALVGVKTLLTGGVARTQHDKNSDVLSVNDFGASPSASAAVNTAAISAAYSNLGPGVKLTFAPGIYLHNGGLAITNQSGWEISGYGATLKAADGLAVTSSTYATKLSGCSDWAIRGLDFDGNRAARTPADVFAHNLIMLGGTRGMVESVNSINGVADGFYIGPIDPNTDINNYPTFVKMRKCYANNNSRQGLSIIGGFDLDIDDCEFSNTTGLAPQAGIDIEANSGAIVPAVDRFRVRNSKFFANVGGGILVTNTYGQPKGIHIEKCVFGNGVANTGAIDIFGETFVESCEFYGYQGYPSLGVIACGWQAQDMGWIKNCYFHDCGGGTALACIYSQSTNGVGFIIAGNRFYNNTIGGIHAESTACIIEGNVSDTEPGWNISSPRAQVTNNIIINTTGPGITCSKGVGVSVYPHYIHIENNVFHANTGNAIKFAYATTAPVIVSNTVYNVATPVNGWIDLTNCTSAICDYNSFHSSAAAATTLAVYAAAGQQSLCNNYATNLHTTQAFSMPLIQGSQFLGNVGGWQNVYYPALVNAFPTANRMAVAAVPVGAMYYDTTLSKPGWSNGTNWKDAAGTNI